MGWAATAAFSHLHYHNHDAAPLAGAIDEYEERVNQLIEEDEDLAEYVERIDSIGDDDLDDPQLPLDFGEDEFDEGDADPEDASSLVDEVEQFLREQDGN